MCNGSRIWRSMSLDKAIKSRNKEWRGRRRKGCGSNCSWCTGNRLYASKKRLMRAMYDQKEVLQEAA
jgi:hypothetical protein